MRAAQLPGRCLGDHARLEDHDVAGPDVDVGEDLVGHLALDPADLNRIGKVIGFDCDGEGFA